MKPICLNCNRIMKTEKNGIICKEIDDDNNDYKIYSADKLKCPQCGHEILYGFGKPICKHENDFENWNKDVEIIFK